MEHRIHSIERADGRTMAYRRFGQGSPVVCLAGGPGADARYLEGLGGLDGGFEMIIPDMRGTGSSAPAATPDGFGSDACHFQWVDERSSAKR